MGKMDIMTEMEGMREELQNYMMEGTRRFLRGMIKDWEEKNQRAIQESNREAFSLHFFSKPENSFEVRRTSHVLYYLKEMYTEISLGNVFLVLIYNEVNSWQSVYEYEEHARKAWEGGGVHGLLEWYAGTERRMWQWYAKDGTQGYVNEYCAVLNHLDYSMVCLEELRDDVDEHRRKLTELNDALDVESFLDEEDRASLLELELALVEEMEQEGVDFPGVWPCEEKSEKEIETVAVETLEGLFGEDCAEKIRSLGYVEVTKVEGKIRLKWLPGVVVDENGVETVQATREWAYFCKKLLDCMPEDKKKNKNKKKKMTRPQLSLRFGYEKDKLKHVMWENQHGETENAEAVNNWAKVEDLTKIEDEIRKVFMNRTV